jgi:hypothetical protein
MSRHDRDEAAARAAALLAEWAKSPGPSSLPSEPYDDPSCSADPCEACCATLRDEPEAIPCDACGHYASPESTGLTGLCAACWENKVDAETALSKLPAFYTSLD